MGLMSLLRQSLIKKHIRISKREEMTLLEEQKLQTSVFGTRKSISIHQFDIEKLNANLAQSVLNVDFEKESEQLKKGWLTFSSSDISKMDAKDKCFCGSGKSIFECHYSLYKKIKRIFGYD